MTMNDLTINISSLNIETLLSDWEWLNVTKCYGC